MDSGTLIIGLVIMAIFVVPFVYISIKNKNKNKGE